MVKVYFFLWVILVILGLCLKDYNFPMCKGVGDFVENQLGVCLALL